MSQGTKENRVELDETTDLELKKWARAEGRSKRAHVAIMLRKLTSLRKTQPDALARLGLIDAALSA